MSAPLPEPNPHIAAMAAYTPGEQPQGGGWVKLNTNENPYPPSPQALAAIRAVVAAEGATLRLYPSPDASPLREAAAKLHAFPAIDILAGNGSDDLLNILIRAYAGPGRPTGMLDPSYSLYPVLAAAQGAGVVKVPIRADFSFDVEAVATCGAAIFFLTNPNAPLGVSFSPAKVTELARAFPGLLVVDEAYAAFADADCAELPKTQANVVVTRTFSKGHALAGLRAGYALCPPGLASVLHRVRDSYNLDRLAQVAAAAALADSGWLLETVGKVRSERVRLTQGLQALGWAVVPSSGNFLLATPASRQRSASPSTSEHAFAFFRERKILVRRFPNHPLTASALRITVGTAAEMDAFLAAAQAWSEG
jgi:histidinol-phosphate aminotransferase